MGNHNNVGVAPGPAPHQARQPPPPPQQQPDRPQEPDPIPNPPEQPAQQPPPQQEPRERRERVVPAIFNLTIGAHATVNINNNQFEFYLN